MEVGELGKIEKKREKKWGHKFNKKKVGEIEK